MEIPQHKSLELWQVRQRWMVSGLWTSLSMWGFKMSDSLQCPDCGEPDVRSMCYPQFCICGWTTCDCQDCVARMRWRQLERDCSCSSSMNDRGVLCQPCMDFEYPEVSKWVTKNVLTNLVKEKTAYHLHSVEINAGVDGAVEKLPKGGLDRGTNIKFLSS